jgi:hypothetical protein
MFSSVDEHIAAAAAAQDDAATSAVPMAVDQPSKIKQMRAA